ncbi:MAG: glucosyltransferase domain-containing protein [Magnetospirillum sp.]|nr:glucosyltransferase domain-containing protein [Magnetospirillum sp.]
MPHGRFLARIAILCSLLGLGVAIWLTLAEFKWQTTLEPAAISADSGYCYIYTTSPAWPLDLAAGKGGTFELRLSEDGRELGPAHSSRVSVRSEGGGRFLTSLLYRKLFFSTSDGGDPRSNGRVYRIGAEVRVDVRLTLAILGISLALLAYGTWGGGRIPPPVPVPFQVLARTARDLFPHLWIYAAVFVIAYGVEMFNLVLSGNDWDALSHAAPRVDGAVNMGRWMQPVLWWLAEDNAFSPALSLSLVAVAYLYLALALSWCLDLQRTYTRLILALLLVTFPLNAEPFAVALMHLPLALGVVAAASAALLIVSGHQTGAILGGRHGWPQLVAAVPCVALAAACYQPVVMFTVAGLSLRALVLLRPVTSAAEMRRSVGGFMVLAGLVMAAAALVYGASILVLAGLSGAPLPGGEGSFSPARMVGLLADLLFSPDQVFPAIAKIVLLASMLLAIGLHGGAGAFWRLPAAVGLLALMVLAPTLVASLPWVGEAPPGGLIAVAAPMACMVAMAMERLPRPGQRRVLAGLGLALVVIFVFEQNRASVTTILLNRRDLSIATRMLDRITQSPAYAPFTGRKTVDVVVVGERLEGRYDLGRAFAPLYGGPSGPRPESELGCGVFNCRISRLAAAFGLISENRVTYAVHIWPSLPATVTVAEREGLAARIGAAHPWPAPDAVVYGQSVVVLILQPSR